jgi:phosphoglycerol transferase MdoB-like AlkP superfamily enzyme
MFAQHRRDFPGKPYFHFGVTIQNHGPYVNKFYWDGFDEVPNFTTDIDFDDADLNALSHYFHGIIDADVQLRRLADYLNALDEPVVLIYYSDHLPAFNPRIYDLLLPDIHSPGSFEDMTRLFTVPFLIWFNYAALELYGISHPQELICLEEDLLFTASFLGAYVMEMLGFTNLSPFWDFNAELRRLFPVITDIRSFKARREISGFLSDYDLVPLRLYRDWSYFRIFDE